jgi:hypothetical protein
MPRRGALPANAEVAVRGTVEPILLRGGGTVKSLSATFLADLEEDWRRHGKEIFPILRGKYPQAYFAGIVALARIIKWEFGSAGAFDRPRTPEEIIDKLEERIGPKGRALFEDFVRKINMLQAEQQLEQEERQQEQERQRHHHAGSAMAIRKSTNW